MMLDRIEKKDDILRALVLPVTVVAISVHNGNVGCVNSSLAPTVTYSRDVKEIAIILVHPKI